MSFPDVQLHIVGIATAMNPESRGSGFDPIRSRFARTGWDRPGTTMEYKAWRVGKAVGDHSTQLTCLYGEEHNLG
jgi:hypothetical protein